MTQHPISHSLSIDPSGRTGSMQSSRLILKGMAVVVGIFGFLIVLGALMIFSMGITGLNAEGAGAARNLILGYLAMLTLFGALAVYLLWTVWKHLRSPSLKSATSLAGSFSFVMALFMFAIVSRKFSKPTPGTTEDPVPMLSAELAVLVAVYLFYRLVLKRLAARAFPPDAAVPTSTSSA